MTKRLILISTLLVALLPSALHAAPGSKLIDRWLAHDPASTTVIDHSDWDRILKANIVTDANGLNRFDYGGISAADKQALKAYVAKLTSTNVDALNREEQYAYWINAYNAITVDLIVDHYPVKSILKVMGGFIGTGPWDNDVVVIMGEDVSLNDIEHGILRPIWDDPRTHYAINCASVGCPNLATDAWTVGNMEAMLDEAAFTFVNSGRAVQKVSKRGIKVSSIYHWFTEDFGDNDAEVIAHIAQYAKGDLAGQLAKAKKIRGHDYDWALNEVK